MTLALRDRVKYGYIHPGAGSVKMPEYSGTVEALRPLFYIGHEPPAGDHGGRTQPGWYAYRDDMDWEGPFVTRGDAESFVILPPSTAHAWLSSLAWNRALTTHRIRTGQQ